VERLDLKVGSVLGGKYRLERALGFGGMGAVWVARNAMTGGDVALKVLHEEVENPEALERFRREANLAARLSHRGIVRVFDLVELHEGTLVMVMELLRGETLASRLDQHTTVPVDTAIGITLAVASALSHAHAAGIVHRDLKPENVFLCLEPDGAIEPKILDFGISKMTGPTLTKLTGDGTLLGTPGYMSPEQTRGDAVDARSDVFALAILLYEMISGANPFYGTTYNAVIAAILEREPEPLAQVSPDVWKVLEKAFAKKRSARYATAAEFATALRHAAGFVGRASSPMLDLHALTGSLPPAPMASRRMGGETPTQAASFLPPQWRARLIAAGATVALLGFAGYVHFHGGSGTEAKDPAATTAMTASTGAVSGSPTGATSAANATTAANAATATPVASSAASSAPGVPNVPAASSAFVLPPPLTPAPAIPLNAKGPRVPPTPARPDGKGPTISRDPAPEPVAPPLTPEPGPGVAAKPPEPAPAPAPVPPPATTPPATTPPAPAPSVHMQTNSGL
jgi:serine/threonine-protein kinase